MAPMILCGIDVLLRDDFKPLEGRKIALITNHTGRTRDGRQTVDVLAKAKGMQLVAIFAPEHGLRGERDETIPDEKDPVTGLPVYSLYNLKEQGEARYKPSKEQLGAADTIVFDIQDIGARFYTYTSTMGFAMETAAEHGLRFVVLDRPNPIGGQRVEGPVSDPRFRGHTAFHTIPTRHGMTAGELARMYQAERGIKVDLQVVWAENWRRSMKWPETGLLWVNPSPNMRSVVQAELYPGICLVEASNLSVGRGTDTPFEHVGAPYISQPEAMQLAFDLNRLRLPGIQFYPVAFTPNASKFSGQLCHGVRFAVTNLDRLEPVRTGMHLAASLARFPEWDGKTTTVRLLQNQQASDTLFTKGAEAALAEARPALLRFMDIRARFLHYK